MVVDPNNIYGADKKGIFDCIFKKKELGLRLFLTCGVALQTINTSQPERGSPCKGGHKTGPPTTPYILFHEQCENLLVGSIWCIIIMIVSQSDMKEWQVFLCGSDVKIRHCLDCSSTLIFELLLRLRFLHAVFRMS